MGGVQHACLGFRLFGWVNKLDNICLKDLCVTKTPLGLMLFFERFNNSYVIFQTLPIPKQIIGFVFQSFSPRYLLVNFGADILQNTLRLALRSSEILG